MRKKITPELIKQIEEIVATGETPLQHYALEKDCHVFDAIKALLAIPANPYFRLVFCGGTCLSKAYGILKRMSEDVDFKVVPTDLGRLLSKTRLRSELSRFIHQIITSLEEEGGFGGNAIERRSRDGNAYTALDVTYESPFSTVSSLRPCLLVELTHTQILKPTSKREIGVLIDQWKPLSQRQQISVECISLLEAVAEKLVSFPRRLSLQIARGYGRGGVSLHESDRWDVSLVRHLYDVHNIARTHPDVLANADELGFVLHRVIEKDALSFKNQHAAFLQDPFTEIGRALEFAKHSDVLKEQYDDFLDDMVYAEESKRMTYMTAVETFDGILRSSLQL